MSRLSSSAAVPPPGTAVRPAAEPPAVNGSTATPTAAVRTLAVRTLALVSLIGVALASVAPGASAGGAIPVVHNDESLASDRPEAWAMTYVAASTFFTAFGVTPALERGRWIAAAELGAVPRLTADEQRVGFDGVKQEDLNRSPVFGRLRAMAGLGDGWIAEVAWTPPLEIDRSKPRDLFAAAIARRVLEYRGIALSLRAFGQHGEAEGDITCPARLAGITDLVRNPYGCRAASDDRIALDYYGVDAIAGGSAGGWNWHVDVAAVRTELAVQVDALTFGVRDRSRLTSRMIVPWIAAGADHALDSHWSAGIEGLYVPLDVKRTVGAARSYDPFATVRVQLRYRFD